MKYVALIPARGGSKGIPRKNIKSFAGKPLIYWTCRAASDCPSIDHVYISTDDKEIADIVRSFNLPKVSPIERAPDTATDTASTESVMLDFCQRADFDNLFLIQATSPLLESKDLAAAISAFETGKYDSLLSAVRQKRFYWQEENNGLSTPLNYAPTKRPRRQDFDGLLVENGAFYLTSRSALLESKCRLSSRVKTIEMDPETYIELDEPEDWMVLESILKKRQSSQGSLKDQISKIRFVASDVDGVLTDSGMYYTENGDELKKFNTRDGKGFELLRKSGYIVGIITAEDTCIVERRAKKLKIDELHQGVSDKVRKMQEIMEKLSLDWSEVAYIGDDLGDQELLKKVGLSACPKDAIATVRDIVHLPLESKGGEGPVREFAEIILGIR